MYSRSLIAIAFFAGASAVGAQSATNHVVMGDKAYEALQPAVALKEYQAAIAADPKNVTALWKASQTAVVLGEFSNSTRDTLYKLGEAYGRRAVALAPK